MTRHSGWNLLLPDRFWVLAVLPWLLLGPGCEQQAPVGSMVLTQVSTVGPRPRADADLLDQRYPAGSRVVLAIPPFDRGQVKILSRGLHAAGDPVVGPAGDRVYFVGKKDATSHWQIYEGGWNATRPKALTAMPGGAMSPTIIAGGALVFSSPVPRSAKLAADEGAPALFRMERGQEAPGQGSNDSGGHSGVERLTFAPTAALDPVALADGRILFVSSGAASQMAGSQPAFGLFTINNDGTELTQFALDGDGAPFVRRPRELSSGRIGLLGGQREEASPLQIETVRSARPFASRTTAQISAGWACTAFEADGENKLLACFRGNQVAGTLTASAAVYSVALNGGTRPALVFDDPAWDEVEAVRAASKKQPVGHVSAIAPGRHTGTILCLNANFTRKSVTDCAPSKAHQVRVVTAANETLGEIPLQEDGSFMAEVPADVAFGLETLDVSGKVLHRLEPLLWVRPGENRSCIGCHEPPNRSPRNHRPLAATRPATVLGKPQPPHKGDF